MSLEGEIHQGGMDDVILMMSQSNLGTAQLLGKIKELLAALPGAEEAGGLLLALARRGTVGSGGERGGDDVEGDGETVAERLEVGGIRFVMNILHTDMEGFDCKAGNVNFGTTCQEFKQTKGVFAARQSNEDFVALVDELVLAQRFVKSFPKFLFEGHSGLLRRNRNTQLFHKHQIDGADDKQECKNVVPVQMGALEHDVGNDAEHGQRDTFLNDLQLDEVERSAILYKAETISRNLTAVFKKGYHPREGDDSDEGPVV